jgi:hypothetical protein
MQKCIVSLIFFIIVCTGPSYSYGQTLYGGDGKTTAAKINMIKPGMSFDEVVKIVGQPGGLETSPDSVTWGYTVQKDDYLVIFGNDLKLKEVKKLKIR